MESYKIDDSFLSPMREFSATDDERSPGIEKWHTEHIIIMYL
jgi:hypothetical protein